MRVLLFKNSLEKLFYIHIFYIHISHIKGANAAIAMTQRFIKEKLRKPELLVLNIPWLQMVSKVFDENFNVIIPQPELI
jgi:hypothetical protein